MSKRRQELYERILASSQDEVIVEEMRRLGFWPERGSLPVDPAEDIQKRGELAREFVALRSELARLGDEQQMLAELRRERLLASRQKQQETKARRAQERRDRALRWHARKADSIGYLGKGYSAGLGKNATAGPDTEHPTSDVARLETAQLPVLHTPSDLAEAMGISMGELRFMAYGRRTATVSHYVRFQIPKKTGGMRLISAPMPRLKELQRWLLTKVLAKVPLHGAAHGFVPNKSIVSNALPHVGHNVVINLDLQNFFPTVEYRRVRGMFRHLGYSEPLATIMAMLCTEPDVEQVELDGETFYVATSKRRLPQGSPASPAISNIICRRLDRRLAGLALGLDYQYTRYADDLTFSGKDPRQVCNVLRKVNDIVAHEGFVVHPDKTRVMRKARRQEVTGIVVNDTAGVNRKELRRFRALLHQVERDGPAGKRWGASDNLFASMRGFASFVHMVNADKGRALLDRVTELAGKHGGFGASAKTAPREPAWKRYQPPAEPPGLEEPDSFDEEEDDEGGEASDAASSQGASKATDKGGRKTSRKKKKKRKQKTGKKGRSRSRNTAQEKSGDEAMVERDERDGGLLMAAKIVAGIVLVVLTLWQLMRVFK